MKIKIVFTFIILSLLFITIPTYAAEVTTDVPVEEVMDWGTYLKEDVLPIVIAVIASGAVLLGTVISAVGRVKTAASKFADSSGTLTDVKDSVEASTKNLNMLSGAMQKTMSRIEGTISDEVKRMSQASIETSRNMQEQFNKEIKAISDQNKVLTKELADVKTILQIAFKNNAELVRNGYAKEIAKVGVSDEVKV